MKKDNKKALYESIMSSVAKQVKKVLNEELTGDGLKIADETNIIKQKDYANQLFYLISNLENQLNKLDIDEIADKLYEIQQLAIKVRSVYNRCIN